MFDSVTNENRSRFEWTVPLCALGLMIIGTAFIYSALERREADLEWWHQTYIKQILWYAAGVGALLAVRSVEYGRLARWAGVYYWGAVVLLVAVFVIGSARNGARRWILGVQPSEFAKLAFLFLLGNVLSRPADELRRPRVFWSVVGYTALPFLLIYKEPDLGSALVFPAISLAMMFVAGIPGRTLLKLVAGTGVAASLVVAVILVAPDKVHVKDYQKNRILSFFGKNKKTDPSRYNVEQALISVGSGGLKGKGWRQGIQHSLGFLPGAGAHNDFIFSVIAEEEGFAGSVVVLALYAALLLSGIKIASQARDSLGKLLAVGVVTLLFCHVFVNVGMNIRLMPVTGIPLPLLSYGGSSVVCSLIAIGILHNVQLNRKSY